MSVPLSKAGERGVGLIVKDNLDLSSKSLFLESPKYARSEKNVKGKPALRNFVSCL